MSLEPTPIKALLPRPATVHAATPFGGLALLDPTSIASTAPAFAGNGPLTAGIAFAPEAMAPHQPAAADAPADPAPNVSLADVSEPDVPEPAGPAIPLPLPRPVFATPNARAVPLPSRRLAALESVAPEAPPAPAPSGFFEKMFGQARPSLPALAYAAPDDAGLTGRPTSPDRWTAVYNIATHTVTLPSGARLEAHSGLGARLDDPRSITEHMRGATPPALYDLTLRDGLFHGVQALRLTPLDPNATYGRMGLLAHSFMLGPRGDSNGCVVFRDYQAFLAAYESGQIHRLAVVTGAS